MNGKLVASVFLSIALFAPLVALAEGSGPAGQQEEESTLLRFDHLNAYSGIAWDESYRKANANLTTSPMAVYEVTKALTEPAIAAGLERSSIFAQLHTLAAYKDVESLKETLRDHPEGGTLMAMFDECLQRQRLDSVGLPRPWPVLVAICTGGRNLTLPTVATDSEADIANPQNRMNVAAISSLAPPLQVQESLVAAQQCFPGFPEAAETASTDERCHRRSLWDQIYYRSIASDENFLSVKNQPWEDWEWKRFAARARKYFGDHLYVDRGPLTDEEKDQDQQSGFRLRKDRVQEPCLLEFSTRNATGNILRDWRLNGFRLLLLERLYDVHGALHTTMYRMCKWNQALVNWADQDTTGGIASVSTSSSPDSDDIESFWSKVYDEPFNAGHMSEPGEVFPQALKNIWPESITPTAIYPGSSGLPPPGSWDEQICHFRTYSSELGLTQVLGRFGDSSLSLPEGVFGPPAPLNVTLNQLRLTLSVPGSESKPGFETDQYQLTQFYRLIESELIEGGLATAQDCSYILRGKASAPEDDSDLVTLLNEDLTYSRVAVSDRQAFLFRFADLVAKIQALDILAAYFQDINRLTDPIDDAKYINHAKALLVRGTTIGVQNPEQELEARRAAYFQELIQLLSEIDEHLGRLVGSTSGFLSERLSGQARITGNGAL